MGKASRRKNERRASAALSDQPPGPIPLARAPIADSEYVKWARSAQSAFEAYVGGVWQTNPNVRGLLNIIDALYAQVADNQRRIEKNVQDVTTRSGSKCAPDCKRGCSYCRHMPIDASGPEVYKAIVCANEKLSDTEEALLVGRLVAYVKQTSRLSEADRRSHSIPCPFLVNDECSIYDGRPLTCRLHNSVDVRLCKREFEGEAVQVPMVFDYHKAASPFWEATVNVLGRAGVLVEPLQFAQAVLLAIEGGPELYGRYLAGNNVFAAVSNAAYNDEKLRKTLPSLPNRLRVIQ